MTERLQPPASVIEIRVGAVSQIFNSLDPSPFRERDLDQAAEQFVMDWAREIPGREPITIKVCLPENALPSEEAGGVPDALRNHFAALGQTARRQMREHFRLGRRYLAIGVAILVACLTLSAAIGAAMPENTFAQILREGLIIIGWVANWKPLEIFLYDWQPIRRRINLYGRLAAARVIVEASLGAADRA